MCQRTLGERLGMKSRPKGGGRWIRVKEQLKRKEVSLTSLVADCPSYLATAKVTDLLQALPGYGPLRADKLLASCRISPIKTMAGLTPRQRQALLETLKG